MARLFILFGAVAIQQWGISGLKFSFLGELERGVEWGDYKSCWGRVYYKFVCVEKLRVIMTD